MKNLLIILLSILIWSCSSDDNSPKITKVESILIAKGNLFGNGTEEISEQNLIVSDQTVWNDLISQMDSANNVSDNFTETDVDFSKYTIIAIFAEIKGNGGHSLELNIITNSDIIIVNITNLVPQEDCSNVITQPFHIVKIQNSNLPIKFE
jgi:hypothetical protein